MLVVDSDDHDSDCHFSIFSHSSPPSAVSFALPPTLVPSLPPLLEDPMAPARATSLLLLLLLPASAGSGGGGGGGGAGRVAVGSSPPYLCLPQGAGGGPPSLSLPPRWGGVDGLGGGPRNLSLPLPGGIEGLSGFSGHLLPPVGAVGGWGVLPPAKREGSRGTWSTPRQVASPEAQSGPPSFQVPSTSLNSRSSLLLFQILRRSKGDTIANFSVPFFQSFVGLKGYIIADFPIARFQSCRGLKGRIIAVSFLSLRF